MIQKLYGFMVIFGLLNVTINLQAMQNNRSLINPLPAGARIRWQQDALSPNKPLIAACNKKLPLMICDGTVGKDSVVIPQPQNKFSSLIHQQTDSYPIEFNKRRFARSAFENYSPADSRSAGSIQPAILNETLNGTAESKTVSVDPILLLTDGTVEPVLSDLVNPYGNFPAGVQVESSLKSKPKLQRSGKGRGFTYSAISQEKDVNTFSEQIPAQQNSANSSLEYIARAAGGAAICAVEKVASFVPRSPEHFFGRTMGGAVREVPQAIGYGATCAAELTEGAVDAVSGVFNPEYRACRAQVLISRKKKGIQACDKFIQEHERSLAQSKIELEKDDQSAVSKQILKKGINQLKDLIGMHIARKSQLLAELHDLQGDGVSLVKQKNQRYDAQPGFVQKTFERELSSLSQNSDESKESESSAAAGASSAVCDTFQVKPVQYLGSDTMTKTPSQRIKDVPNLSPELLKLALTQHPLCNTFNVLRKIDELRLCRQLVQATGQLVTSQYGQQVQNQVEANFDMMLHVATNHQNLDQRAVQDTICDVRCRKNQLGQHTQALLKELDESATSDEKRQAQEYAQRSLYGQPGGFGKKQLLSSDVIFNKLGLEISLDTFCKEFNDVVRNDARGLQSWLTMRLAGKKIGDLYATLDTVQERNKKAIKFPALSSKSDSITPILETLKTFDPLVMTEYQFGLLAHTQNKGAIASLMNTQNAIVSLGLQQQNLKQLLDEKSR